MSAWVAALIGLAAWFADRGVRHVRRAPVRAAARVPAQVRVGRGSSAPLLARAPAWAGVVVGFLVWGPLGAVAGVGLVLVAPRVHRARRRRAERGQLDEQVADAVHGIAAAMRAGMSVPQALAWAGGEAEPPLRDHLQRLVADLEVGEPLADALAAWGRRTGTDDALLVASALELHRRAGGDLPAVLDQVGATIRDRVAAAREVRALTAQARLSGLILGLLPVGFFAFLWLTSSRDMAAALGTPAGAISVGLGSVLELSAFIWIRKLLAVSA